MRVSPQIIWLPMPNAFVLCRPLQKAITARLWHRPEKQTARPKASRCRERVQARNRPCSSDSSTGAIGQFQTVALTSHFTGKDYLPAGQAVVVRRPRGDGRR